MCLASLQLEKMHISIVLHFCSKGAEKAGMMHCCEVGWEWSPVHCLGQVRATLAWHGRKKNSAKLFHCNRDITEYSWEKKLTVSELEKGGTGDHQPLLKIFLACSTGCCWLLIWFQVFVLCCRITGCLPVASLLALGSAVQEMASCPPNFYFYLKSFLLSGREETENSTWQHLLYLRSSRADGIAW